MPGQGSPSIGHRVCSPRACMHHARAPRPHSWPSGPSARPRVSPASPSRNAKLAHAAAVSWGEIDTFQTSSHAGLIRASLCRRVNVLSRRDRPRGQCQPRRRCYADPRCAQAYPERPLLPRLPRPRRTSMPSSQHGLRGNGEVGRSAVDIAGGVEGPRLRAPYSHDVPQSRLRLRRSKLHLKRLWLTFFRGGSPWPAPLTRSKTAFAG
jgi:hypothetical protein